MRIGLFISETGTHGSSIEDLVETATWAEANGIDTGWVPHIPWSLDALTALAIVGRETSRIELGTAVVPTINGSFITTYLDQTNHVQDDYLRYLGPALKRTYNWRIDRAAKDNAAAIEFRHKNFEAGASLLPLLYKSGVTILAGTDAGYLNSFNYPGLGMHDELAIMVKYGLSPQQALICSIVNGPAFFNQSKAYGSVTIGKNADLLLLNANPLMDINNTKKIDAVVNKGKYLSRKELDEILSATAEKVKLLK